MNLSHLVQRLLLVLAALCLLPGCGSVDYIGGNGEIGRPAAGKGLVVFYREDHILHSETTYRLTDGFGYANAVPLCSLRNGTYFTYDADPGRHFLKASTEIMAQQILDVQPGHVYFIRGAVRPGILVGRPDLHLVSNEEGRQAIHSLRRVKQHVKPDGF